MWCMYFRSALHFSRTHLFHEISKESNEYSMNQLELEDLIRQSLDDFYQRRANRLSELKLSDILGKKNPYLIRAVGTQRAFEIVSELLKIYLTSFDEGIFGQTQWEELAEHPDFYQK